MPSTRQATQRPLRCFTVDEYHRMIESGVLREGEKVELIEGAIVEMASLSGRHIGCVMETGRYFTLHLGETARVSIQNSVRLGPRSEPEPDIAILRPRADNYRSEVPLAADVLLLIEVADTSFAYDRGAKLPLYARAAIPELWIVDLNAERVLVYRDPSGRAYTSVSEHRRGETIAPLAFPDLTISVDTILG